MYEDLISYILDGCSNNELKKITRHKRIKIKGIREVNDRTRDIVLKNLKTKSNLFELYQLWKSPKNKLLEYSEIHKLNLEEIINYIDLGKLNSFEAPSNYLLSMIEIDGFEKATYFWEINKEVLENIRLNGEIEVKYEEKKENDSHNIIKNHLIELEKSEKKQSKERLKWQINGMKKDKMIKHRDDEVFNLQNERKEIQKKYSNRLDELKRELETNKIDLKEMNNLIIQSDNLRINFERINIENNDLKKENFKKYEFISELKNINEMNINEIKKLNQLIQKQKNDKIILESAPAILDLKVGIDTEQQNNEEFVEKQQISSLENDNQVMKEGEVHQKGEQKKILVFGDITGLSYKEIIFEIYTSNTMPEDISILNEDDYQAIWLIKYRFAKKGQRSLILKKFKKVKTINNYVELEGAYKNELQI